MSTGLQKCARTACWKERTFKTLTRKLTPSKAKTGWTKVFFGQTGNGPDFLGWNNLIGFCFPNRNRQTTGVAVRVVPGCGVDASTSVRMDGNLVQIHQTGEGVHQIGLGLQRWWCQQNQQVYKVHVPSSLEKETEQKSGLRCVLDLRCCLFCVAFSAMVLTKNFLANVFFFSNLVSVINTGQRQLTKGEIMFLILFFAKYLEPFCEQMGKKRGEWDREMGLECLWNQPELLWRLVSNYFVILDFGCLCTCGSGLHRSTLFGQRRVSCEMNICSFFNDGR